MNNSELKKLLGLRIKFYRSRLGLTQEELGERIEISQRQVSLIEIGSSFPSPNTLTKLGEVFNCSIRDLFDFESVYNIVNIKNELVKIIGELPDEKLKTLYILGKHLNSI